METKFTPGPWTYHYTDIRSPYPLRIVGRNGESLMNVADIGFMVEAQKALAKAEGS